MLVQKKKILKLHCYCYCYLITLYNIFVCLYYVLHLRLNTWMIQIKMLKNIVCESGRVWPNYQPSISHNIYVLKV